MSAPGQMPVGSAPSFLECSVSHFRHQASLFLCAISKGSPETSLSARTFAHSVVEFARQHFAKEKLGLVKFYFFFSYFKIKYKSIENILKSKQKISLHS